MGTRASRAFRVLWMLEELGLNYEHKPLQPHSKELVKLSQQGKIPVLIDEDRVISDSTAILTYLAEGYNHFTFYPGSQEKARQDSMTHQILCDLESCVWSAAKHSFVFPKERRVADLKPTLKWEFSKEAAALCECLELDEYLMGNVMTIPDFILTHCLDWAEVAKFDKIPPKMESYLERMRSREAYQRVTELA